jgi:hypothetical protein
VGLTVSGTASQSGSGEAGWEVELSQSFGDPNLQRIAGQTGQVTFLAIPFTFGTPFNVILDLVTDTAEHFSIGNGSASSDFLPYCRTLRIAGF